MTVDKEGTSINSVESSVRSEGSTRKALFCSISLEITMEKNIFRKKSIERVSSPEQLNDYIRVTSPNVWAILLAVIVFLTGVFVWGVLGHLDTRLTVAGICKDGTLTCYVKESDIGSVKAGMPVTVGENVYEVALVESKPVSVTNDLGAYALHIGGLQTGEWVYPVIVNTELEDGTYQTTITIESVSPISFIIN